MLTFLVKVIYLPHLLFWMKTTKTRYPLNMSLKISAWENCQSMRSQWNGISVIAFLWLRLARSTIVPWRKWQKKCEPPLYLHPLKTICTPLNRRWTPSRKILSKRATFSICKQLSPLGGGCFCIWRRDEKFMPRRGKSLLLRHIGTQAMIQLACVLFCVSSPKTPWYKGKMRQVGAIMHRPVSHFTWVVRFPGLRAFDNLHPPPKLFGVSRDSPKGYETRDQRADL